MPKSNLRQFKANGFLWLVNLTHDAAVAGGIYGPFSSLKECRAARSLVPGHERSNVAVDRYLRPQPHDKRDVNILTR